MNFIFICIIRDEEDDDNASEAETYLENQTTRYCKRYRACCRSLCLYVCSEPSPPVDETNVGNRDDALKKTYRGLVNLRYGSLIIAYSYLLTICVSQEGLYDILVDPASDITVLHRNCVRCP